MARRGPGQMLCVLLLLRAVQAASAQPEISQADLLRRITDVQRLTTPPPAGERTLMFSSYDRAARVGPDGQFLDWDANADAGQFLRREPDGWDVLAEIDGPGALTRIWSANPQGTLRFVLDGENVLELECAALFAGKTSPFEAPFVSRGLNCYFPLGFSQSCRVLCRDSTMYYQVNVVQFPPGTRVQRFSPQLDEAAQAALAEVKAALEQGLSQKQLLAGGRAMPVAVQEDVKPGAALRESVKGEGTVRALYVALTDRVNPRELYALHRCVLRIWFDGAEQPAVEAPLADFFGSGFDLVPFNSLLVGTDRVLPIPLPDRRTGEDRFMFCHFPMPFRDGVQVEIENRNEGRRDIGLLLVMQVDRRRPAADALRFHARFRREDPCAALDYPILEAEGRGRVVGCVLNVDCPRATWWGEGDDKVWIDGEPFPSYFGTGSEDYLGDAWGLHAHIAPLQGVTRTGPYGKNSAYRWHVPDCINFQKSVRFTIECWPAAGPRDTYYSTVAYWYGEPRPAPFFAALTDVDLDVPGLRIPGAVEIEGRVAGEQWGSDMKQKFAGGAELSGEAAANVTTDRPVAITLPAPRAERVRLKLRTNPRRSFETVTVTAADGRVVGTATYDRENRASIYELGVLELAAGDNVLHVQCAKSTMLDCWILEPAPESPAGAASAPTSAPVQGR